MKEKTSLKTLAGLALAAVAWRRLSESAADEPPIEYIEFGKPTDPCPPGQYRGAYDIIRQGYVCIIPGK